MNDDAVKGHVSEQEEGAKARLVAKQAARDARKAARSAAKQREKDAHRGHVQAAYDSLKADHEALQQQHEALRQSYYLAGMHKKIDVATLAGFADLAGAVRAEGRLGMDLDRLYTLWQAAHAAPEGLPVVEVGSYKGGSARFIASAFRAAGRSPVFYVCDTFAGHARVDAALDGVHTDRPKFLDTSAEAVASYLREFPSVQLVVGDILETGSQLAREPAFAMVHVDVDVYPATRFCLELLAPRLAPGALMVLDDYGFTTCPGSKKAVDEFVAARHEFTLLHLLTGQAVLFRAG